MVRLRRESTQVAPSFSQVTLRLGMGHKPLAFTDVLLFCRGYLIAAPSVFRSGVEEAISVTIFNSPREVMVQAQLVALGKAVAQSQGAIQGRSLGCLTRPSSPSAEWS